ncbi:cytochrome P450 [Kitasatospora sp. NPDC048545]|uniref:cytochrome P450 n=1 Tax=Kitasatospora sp. NPDC048545 TaxID=3157208 RepID=UPI0033E7AC75
MRVFPAVAGNETLRNGLPGGLYSLLTHADEYARLSRQPGLMPAAVDELLRFWPPVLDFRRTATRDVVLAGQLIRGGDKVVVYHVSANRDEAVFPEPDRLDIARTPNDHVSFGFGPHFCVGARLARIQMSALLRRIIAELPDLELTSGVPPTRLVSNFQNGLKRLSVRWR